MVLLEALIMQSELAVDQTINQHFICLILVKPSQMVVSLPFNLTLKGLGSKSPKDRNDMSTYTILSILDLSLISTFNIITKCQ